MLHQGDYRQKEPGAGLLLSSLCMQSCRHRTCMCALPSNGHLCMRAQACTSCLHHTFIFTNEKSQICEHLGYMAHKFVNPCVDFAANRTVFMMKDDNFELFRLNYSELRIFQPFLTIVCMGSFYSQKLHIIALFNYNLCTHCSTHIGVYVYGGPNCIQVEVHDSGPRLYHLISRIYQVPVGRQWQVSDSWVK